MAYNNKKHNNNQNNNYFTNQLQRLQGKNTENFLDTLNARDLQLDAIRIIRDLTRNRIKVEDFAQYFYDVRLKEALYEASLTKANLYSISAIGVELYLNTPAVAGNQLLFNTTTQVLDFHKKSASAWSMIHEIIIAFNNSNNIEYLKTIYSTLYKNRLLNFI